jgi:hypothetical protein
MEIAYLITKKMHDSSKDDYDYFTDRLEYFRTLLDILEKLGVEE